MAEQTEPTLKRHRKNAPQNCVRCSNSHRAVPAEWDLKPVGEKMMALCETHARYWSAQHGIMTFPADK